MNRLNERFLEYIHKQTYLELTNENIITREELNEWCEELKINKPSDEKSTLYYIEYLSKEGITYLDFYNRYKHKAYGIHPSRFDNKFKVNKYQRRKMIDTGYLKIAYYKLEEIYPKRFEEVPFLNAEKYFEITKEDIEIWRAENIKGYKFKQLRLDI